MIDALRVIWLRLERVTAPSQMRSKDSIPLLKTFDNNVAIIFLQQGVHWPTLSPPFPLVSEEKNYLLYTFGSCLLLHNLHI